MWQVEEGETPTSVWLSSHLKYNGFAIAIPLFLLQAKL